jgi:hypothetical protein
MMVSPAVLHAARRSRHEGVGKPARGILDDTAGCGFTHRIDLFIVAHAEARIASGAPL